MTYSSLDNNRVSEFFYRRSPPIQVSGQESWYAEELSRDAARGNEEYGWERIRLSMWTCGVL